MSNSQNCCVCQKPNGNLQCTKCSDPICKSCAQFSSADNFALSDAKPEELPIGTFCSSCYESEVAGALAAYNEAAERAENIFVYYKAQAKENRFIRRKEKQMKVPECDDKDLVLLRLAFIAAKAGYNCLVDVEVTSKKIGTGGYLRALWSAVGIPVNADLRRIQAQLRVTE